jgi:hypothetical protein
MPPVEGIKPEGCDVGEESGEMISGCVGKEYMKIEVTQTMNRNRLGREKCKSEKVSPKITLRMNHKRPKHCV